MMVKKKEEPWFWYEWLDKKGGKWKTIAPLNELKDLLKADKRIIPSSIKKKEKGDWWRLDYWGGKKR